METAKIAVLSSRILTRCTELHGALWRLTGAELSSAASGPIGKRTTAEPMSSFPHSSKKFGAQNYAIEAAPDSRGLRAAIRRMFK